MTSDRRISILLSAKQVPCVGTALAMDCASFVETGSDVHRSKALWNICAIRAELDTLAAVLKGDPERVELAPGVWAVAHG